MFSPESIRATDCNLVCTVSQAFIHICCLVLESKIDLLSSDDEFLVGNPKASKKCKRGPLFNFRIIEGSIKQSRVFFFVVKTKHSNIKPSRDIGLFVGKPKGSKKK